ncbi:class I SAM-dependent methyltransferase [Paenibacillus sp. UNC451MF]|uniref:class I SAM-dependent methyltransferase n=1 Tax=Paenibacillus sp. UNC451MF TaxID=1449063 RepID=UPI000491E86B|nr:class I SAM-dependent methyltransferase [Paenibacillus sp. UNC451MF]
MADELKKTFNEVAELYDRARNQYPQELFDELFQQSGCHSESHVLEIGAGTGIATLPIAELGCSVTAVELGEAMAQVARHKLAKFDKVDVQVGAFEEWEPPIGMQYDLVLVATAFHWLDPSVRYTKIASLLRPGGHLAIVRYHHVAGGDLDFFDLVQDCYERFKPGVTKNFRLPDMENILSDSADLEASGLFNEPVRRSFIREETYNKQQYLDLLSTYSDHLMMEDSERHRLYNCIGSLIDGQFDGQVIKCYLHELVIAQKR